MAYQNAPYVWHTQIIYAYQKVPYMWHTKRYLVCTIRPIYRSLMYQPHTAGGYRGVSHGLGLPVQSRANRCGRGGRRYPALPMRRPGLRAASTGPFQRLLRVRSGETEVEILIILCPFLHRPVCTTSPRSMKRAHMHYTEYSSHDASVVRCVTRC